MMSSRSTLVAASLALSTAGCTVQRWQASAATRAADEHAAHMSPSSVAQPALATPAWSGSGTFQGIAGIPASNSAAAERLKASPRKGAFAKVAYEPGSKDSLEVWVSYP